MREFDVFVPLFYNDGRPIDASLFQELQQRLLAHFDGLTFFPEPNQGYWKMGPVVFRDEIVIYRVLADKRSRARHVLSRIKKWMKKVFQQEEILIVERKVGLIP